MSMPEIFFINLVFFLFASLVSYTNLVKYCKSKDDLKKYLGKILKENIVRILIFGILVTAFLSSFTFLNHSIANIKIFTILDGILISIYAAIIFPVQLLKMFDKLL